MLVLGHFKTFIVRVTDYFYDLRFRWMVAYLQVVDAITLYFGCTNTQFSMEVMFAFTNTCAAISPPEGALPRMSMRTDAVQLQSSLRMET